MLSKKHACAMMLLGTLLFTGCASTAYQQGLTAGERLSQMTQQNAQLERRIVDLEKQLASRQAPVAPPPAAPQPHYQTWRQRFNAIPYGSTYSAVVQAVGQPGHTERKGSVALCVYYISDQEIYMLVFESGVYTRGFVDTYANWVNIARGDNRY